MPDLAGASLKRAMFSPRVDEAHRQTFIPTQAPFSPPEPFTRWKRLIARNTGGVISADSRSIAFDIKQTRDYCVITNRVPREYLHMQMGYALILGMR